jgi:glycerophosphoryl diester phosphodiesterase
MTTVIAHRGASAAAPENTLAAARLAVRHGADVVECDVHRTRDGELVVLHDRHVRRTTDGLRVLPGRGRLRVAELTLAEIKRLDAGSWFGGDYAGEQVPTLREWAEAIGGRAGLLIEMKHPSTYPGIEMDLTFELLSAPALVRAESRGQVTIQSFDHDWLQRFHGLMPHVPVGMLTEERPTADLIDTARRFAHQVNPSVPAVDRETVQRLRDAGLRVSVWTPNSPRQLRRVVGYGVDGVITNHPHRLRGLVGHAAALPSGAGRSA